MYESQPATVAQEPLPLSKVLSTAAATLDDLQRHRTRHPVDRIAETFPISAYYEVPPKTEPTPSATGGTAAKKAQKPKPAAATPAAKAPTSPDNTCPPVKPEDVPMQLVSTVYALILFLQASCHSSTACLTLASYAVQPARIAADLLTGIARHCATRPSDVRGTTGSYECGDVYDPGIYSAAVSRCKTEPSSLNCGRLLQGLIDLHAELFSSARTVALADSCLPTTAGTPSPTDDGPPAPIVRSPSAPVATTHVWGIHALQKAELFCVPSRALASGGVHVAEPSTSMASSGPTRNPAAGLKQLIQTAASGAQYILPHDQSLIFVWLPGEAAEFLSVTPGTTVRRAELHQAAASTGGKAFWDWIQRCKPTTANNASSLATPAVTFLPGTRNVPRPDGTKAAGAGATSAAADGQPVQLTDEQLTAAQGHHATLFGGGGGGTDDTAPITLAALKRFDPAVFEVTAVMYVGLAPVANHGAGAGAPSAARTVLDFASVQNIPPRAGQAARDHSQSRYVLRWNADATDCRAVIEPSLQQLKASHTVGHPGSTCSTGGQVLIALRLVTGAPATVTSPLASTVNTRVVANNSPAAASAAASSSRAGAGSAPAPAAAAAPSSSPELGRRDPDRQLVRRPIVPSINCGSLLAATRSVPVPPPFSWSQIEPLAPRGSSPDRDDQSQQTPAVRRPSNARQAQRAAAGSPDVAPVAVRATSSAVSRSGEMNDQSSSTPTDQPPAPVPSLPVPAADPPGDITTSSSNQPRVARGRGAGAAQPSDAPTPVTALRRSGRQSQRPRWMMDDDEAVDVDDDADVEADVEPIYRGGRGRASSQRPSARRRNADTDFDVDAPNTGTTAVKRSRSAGHTSTAAKPRARRRFQPDDAAAATQYRIDFAGDAMSTISVGLGKLLDQRTIPCTFAQDQLRYVTRVMAEHASEVDKRVCDVLNVALALTYHTPRVGASGSAPWPSASFDHETGTYSAPIGPGRRMAPEQHAEATRALSHPRTWEQARQFALKGTPPASTSKHKPFAGLVILATDRSPEVARLRALLTSPLPTQRAPVLESESLLSTAMDVVLQGAAAGQAAAFVTALSQHFVERVVDCLTAQIVREILPGALSDDAASGQNALVTGLAEHLADRIFDWSATARVGSASPSTPTVDLARYAVMNTDIQRKCDRLVFIHRYEADLDTLEAQGMRGFTKAEAPAWVRQHLSQACQYTAYLCHQLNASTVPLDVTRAALHPLGTISRHFVRLFTHPWACILQWLLLTMLARYQIDQTPTSTSTGGRSPESLTTMKNLVILGLLPRGRHGHQNVKNRASLEYRKDPHSAWERLVQEQAAAEAVRPAVVAAATGVSASPSPPGPLSVSASVPLPVVAGAGADAISPAMTAPPLPGSAAKLPAATPRLPTAGQAVVGRTAAGPLTAAHGIPSPSPSTSPQPAASTPKPSTLVLPAHWQPYWPPRCIAPNEFSRPEHTTDCLFLWHRTLDVRHVLTQQGRSRFTMSFQTDGYDARVSYTRDKLDLAKGLTRARNILTGVLPAAGNTTVGRDTAVAWVGHPTLDQLRGLTEEQVNDIARKVALATIAAYHPTHGCWRQRKLWHSFAGDVLVLRARAEARIVGIAVDSQQPADVSKLLEWVRCSASRAARPLGGNNAGGYRHQYLKRHLVAPAAEIMRQAFASIEEQTFTKTVEGNLWGVVEELDAAAAADRGPDVDVDTTAPEFRVIVALDGRTETELPPFPTSQLGYLIAAKGGVINEASDDYTPLCKRLPAVPPNERVFTRATVAQVAAAIQAQVARAHDFVDRVRQNDPAVLPEAIRNRTGHLPSIPGRRYNPCWNQFTKWSARQRKASTKKPPSASSTSNAATGTGTSATTTVEGTHALAPMRAMGRYAVFLPVSCSRRMHLHMQRGFVTVSRVRDICRHWHRHSSCISDTRYTIRRRTRRRLGSTADTGDRGDGQRCV